MQGLGQSVSEHRLTWGARILGVGGTSLLTAACLALEFKAMERLMDATDATGKVPPGGSLNGDPALLIALWGFATFMLAGAVGLCGWRLLQALRRLRTRVTVCEQGLRLALGSRVEEHRWEEVGELRCDARRVDGSSGALMDVRRVWLHLMDRVEPLELHALTSFQLLADGLMEETSKRGMPAVQAALGKGLDVDFGAWKLSPAGVFQGPAGLPWSMLGRLGIDGGVLYLESADEKTSLGNVALAAIPNPHVLAAVVTLRARRAAPVRRQAPSVSSAQGARPLVGRHQLMSRA